MSQLYSMFMWSGYFWGIVIGVVVFFSTALIFPVRFKRVVQASEKEVSPRVAPEDSDKGEEKTSTASSSAMVSDKDSSNNSLQTEENKKETEQGKYQAAPEFGETNHSTPPKEDAALEEEANISQGSSSNPKTKEDTPSHSSSSKDIRLAMLMQEKMRRGGKDSLTETQFRTNLEGAFEEDEKEPETDIERMHRQRDFLKAYGLNAHSLKLLSVIWDVYQEEGHKKGLKIEEWIQKAMSSSSLSPAVKDVVEEASVLASFTSNNSALFDDNYYGNR